MITYTTGNLLDADVEALVNTVNTVGVMGKGIALMFKERFPDNMQQYAIACKAGQVATGKMFITEHNDILSKTKWIINFPTKQHWRSKSKIEWIDEGLVDLKNVLITQQIKSIAIPPLGAGNGGLKWQDVKPHIERHLSELEDVEIVIYEPTMKYQNIRKTTGVQTLTPARALVSELVRRYWALGVDCSFLELQKLVWFLQRSIEQNHLNNEVKGNFKAHYYGPYADNIKHLLNALDGSFLISDKRIPDSNIDDIIWFNNEKTRQVEYYLKTTAKGYYHALDEATGIISGFETPYGLELLATVDWLITQENYNADVNSLKEGLKNWKAGKKWGERKLKMFTDERLELALKQLHGFSY